MGNGNTGGLISDAKQIMDWLDDNDILMNLTENDIALLINYMESHGYQLGLSLEGLIRMGNNSGIIQKEPITIDDIIDTVCEWNYEMIQHAKGDLESAVGLEDYLHRKEYYNGLRADEKLLNKMFQQTRYGMEIYDLAAKLAEETIRQLQKTGNLDKAALVVSDGLNDLQLESTKGR